MINDSRWSVVIGCAGAGKTSYAMGLLEQALRQGRKWHEIGFSSFSRAACQEAVRRAATLCGEAEERLTSHGWYRTLHAAALRSIGAAGRILDPDSKTGREFYAEAKLPRGGDRGTVGESVGLVLDRWDLARQMVWPLVDRSPLGDLPVGETVAPGAPDWGGVRAGGAHAFASEKTGFSASARPPITHIGDFFTAISSRRPRNWVPVATELHKSICSKGFGARTPPVIGCAGCAQIGDSKVDRSSVHWCAGVAEAKWADDVVRTFEEQKRLHNLLDFTDVLMRFIGLTVDTDTDNRLITTTPEGTAPDDCSVWFVDEAQDCSPLLWMAADRLTTNAEDVIVLGDPYQAVYGFLGAAPDLLIGLADGSRQRGSQTVLNRSWRNPECVLQWAETILLEDPDYETRQPFSEHDDGSVGIVEWGTFVQGLEHLAEIDTMILGRTWFSLGETIKALDAHGIPWTSCSDKMSSKWDAPVQLANVLTLRELQQGLRISEIDYRRLTEHFPAKHPTHGEFFTRGAKAKWKKAACSQQPKNTLHELTDWDATPAFIEFVQNGHWKTDKFAILDYAIARWGIDAVRHPRVKLGTCHSVKGMEADVVYCLATSTAKCEDADEHEERNLKYVAITRAKHDYRLVYRNADLSGGTRQFWCAPEKKTLTHEHIDRSQPFLQTRKRKPDPVEDPRDAEETEYLVREDPSDWVQPEWDSGHPDLPPREIPRDGDQNTRASQNSDTTPENGTTGDQEEWWSL